jgi:general secretion pathway protein A
MYLEYWGLHDLPFENTPDPRFFYLSSIHQEALVRMLYATKGRKGAFLLIGEIGAGKTILSRRLIAQLPAKQYDISLVTNPSLPPTDLLREILYQFGVTTPSGDRQEQRGNLSNSKLELLHALNEHCLRNWRQGKDTVIIVDEAQCIDDPETFEELRLLLNFQLNERFLLTLLLIGQPELKERIAMLPQLEQRIALRYHLTALDAEETANYIQHRLSVAQASRPIFTPEALRAIYDYTRGVPRRINTLCDFSLLVGANTQATMIDARLIAQLIQEGI